MYNLAGKQQTAGKKKKIDQKSGKEWSNKFLINQGYNKKKIKRDARHFFVRKSFN